MTNQWKCHFKKMPEAITVGDPLLLACDGEIPVSLKKEKLFIRFLQSENKYKLYILEVVHLDSLSAELIVTSYRTGDFQENFFITDGEREVFVEGLQFSVKSLLPQSPLSPHPPLWSLVHFFTFVLFYFVGICGDFSAFNFCIANSFFCFKKNFFKKSGKKRYRTSIKGFCTDYS